MITHFMRQKFSRNLFSKLAGLVAMPVLKALKEKIDPRRYNGASLVGLNGIVVKSHGSADAFAFSNAVKEAVLEVKKSVPEKINQQLENLLTEQQVG